MRVADGVEIYRAVERRFSDLTASREPRGP
jgi:hypothetical protein